MKKRKEMKKVGSMNERNGKMFPFITCTWNPLGGKCLHNCSYCWAKLIIKRFAMKKYSGKPHLSLKELKRVFTERDFVFVCDMCDLFGNWVPTWMIQRILDRIAVSQATFLLLTKNPQRYLEFDIPENCMCGATIESDYDTDLSNAPSRVARIKAMANLKHPRKMVSIEPVMHFSPEFGRLLLLANPEFIAVGYDNYDSKLTEPKLQITEILISMFEAYGIKVYRKTLREAWNNA